MKDKEILIEFSDIDRYGEDVIKHHLFNLKHQGYIQEYGFEKASTIWYQELI